MRAKPEVGQTVYAVETRRHSRRKLFPLIVHKVGRKYFYVGPEKCSDWAMTKCHIDGWYEASEYSPSVRLYESEQDYAETMRHDALYSKILKWFGRAGRRELSLRQCEEIAHTLGIVQEDGQ